jgi:hypothetical protein
MRQRPPAILSAVRCDWLRMTLPVFLRHRPRPALRACAAPVIKVSTHSELKQRWHDLIDVDAGSIATGDAMIEDVGWELCRLLLDVASGRENWAEHRKLTNSLALFNPGPVTSLRAGRRRPRLPKTVKPPSAFRCRGSDGTLTPSEFRL